MSPHAKQDSSRFSRPLFSMLAAALFAAAPVAVSGQEESRLVELVVTAQKREQSLQDIPVAVTAVAGEQLVEYGITDVFDLQQNVPSLISDRSQVSTTANFSIRGIGTSAQNFGLEPSVGLYVDGVYRAQPSSIINELVDIERVEVVRGPQGTLFGRNTSAGAILINSVAPNHEGGDNYFELSYGNLDLFTANGGFGASLVEDLLAVRVTGFLASRDGYVDALGLDANQEINIDALTREVHVDAFGSGKSVINDRDRWGGRVQLLFTPNEDLSARVILDYAELNEVCCAAGTLRNNYFSFNGQPGSDALFAALGAPVISENQLFDDVVAVGFLPTSSNEDKGASAEINWDVGPGKVTSITAFRKFSTFDNIDADFSAADVVNRLNDAKSDTFSQELRFAYDSERFNYIAGAYYFTQDLYSRTDTSFGLHSNAVLVNSNPDLAAAVNGVNALSAATGGLVPTVANAGPPGTSARNMMTQDHEAWALFGQVDFRVMEQLELSAGLRYTDENKDLLGVFEQDNTGPPPNFTAIGTNLALVSAGLARPDLQALGPLFAPGWGFYLLPVLAPRPNVDETLNDSQLTWNVKLSWFANDDLMFYGGYATGFKSGGTNTDRIHPAFSQLFGAETSDSFEVGVKADFPAQHLRANLTLHYTTIKDFQSNSFTGTGFNLQNAGKLDVKGGELEVTWQPTANVMFSGSYTYNDAEYDSFVRANCWVATPFLTGQPDPGRRNPNDQFCDRSGDRKSGNPEHAFILSASTSYPLSATVNGYVHADYNYRSSIVTDINVDPLKLHDGFGLLNARAGLVLQGIDLDVALWARNLLDEDYTGLVFDVPLQTGKLNTYAREPRTFGVTVRKLF